MTVIHSVCHVVRWLLDGTKSKFESTAGSTGIALWLLCALIGFPMWIARRYY